MSRPLSYYAWPISIVIFFLVLAAGNTAMYLLANDAHEGSELVERGSYERGLGYQRKLDALERFRRSGIQASVSVVAENNGTVLELRLIGKNGTPLSGENIHATAVYAASGEHDQALKLEESVGAPGDYRAPFVSMPGVFLLSFEFERATGESLIFETRSLVPGTTFSPRHAQG